MHRKGKQKKQGNKVSNRRRELKWIKLLIRCRRNRQEKEDKAAGKKGEVNHNIQNIQKHSDLPEGLESSVKLFADDTSLFSAI